MEKNIPHSDKNTYFPWLENMSPDYRMILKITCVTSTSCEPQSVPSAGSCTTHQVCRIAWFLFRGLKKPLVYKSLRSFSPSLFLLSSVFLSSLSPFIYFFFFKYFLRHCSPGWPPTRSPRPLPLRARITRIVGMCFTTPWSFI